MLKYLLIISILFTTAHGEERKIPPEVSLKMYVGALISFHNLSNDSKYSSYYSTHVVPISNSVSYSEDSRNIRAYQREKGKEFLSAKIIFGAYRNMLNDDDLLVLLNLAKHEKEEQEFIELLSQAYVSRMDSVIFINDSIDNSSEDNSKYIKFDIFNPIVLGADLQIKFAKGNNKTIEIRSNHRKYTDIVKHCFRQIVKNYKVDDYKVEIIWKRIDGVEPFLRTPLEIYMALANQGRSAKSATYFGDFSHTGKIRSWGLIRENFKHFKESGNKVAYVPLDDLEDLKEISLLQGKASVIRNQFIGVQTINEFTEAEGNHLKPEAIQLYNEVLGNIRNGRLKGAAIISALNKVLSIQPNHLSARLYIDLLSKKYVTKMSLMNSFFEFEILFNRFKREGFFTTNKAPTSADLLDMEEETSTLFRVADRRVMTMCKSLLETIKTVRSFEKSNNKSIQKGVKQKYFQNLRTLNYQRDLLIDNQAAIDRIYTK